MLTNTELTQFLISTVSLLISTVSLLIMALSVGYAFERMRLPRVIGEICGGLLVGPSVLGLLMPGVTEWFVPEGNELLSKVGDGGFQAARSISFSPSLNLTPSTISARR